jgi:hypothetical protein
MQRIARYRAVQDCFADLMARAGSIIGAEPAAAHRQADEPCDAPAVVQAEVAAGEEPNAAKLNSLENGPIIVTRSYRVEPFALPNVKPEQWPRIFGDFREVVGQHLRGLRAAKASGSQLKEHFFEFLIEEVDAGAYAEIQANFLDPGILDTMGDMLKYLDPVMWFEGRFSSAVRLGLDQSVPLRILDFGTGPGHFPMIASFLGHDVLGTELPELSPVPTNSERLYDALCGIFGVSRIRYTVRPHTELTGLPGRFAMVTSFMAAFNLDEQKKPWTVRHWSHFLASLKKFVLDPDGRLFMTLANNKLTPEAWRHLESHATWSIEKTKSLFFAHLDAFETDGRAARLAQLGSEAREPSAGAARK